MNVNFMTFEQWKEANPDVEATGKEIDCPECGGDGEVTCDRCGHTHDCHECDGSGKIKDGDTLKDIYDRQLASDKKILDRYLKMFPETTVIK